MTKDKTIFHRVYNLGTVKENNRFAKVFVKVEILSDTLPTIPRPLGENARFSMSGVIGPMKSGNALGSCGQIDDTIKEYVTAGEMKYAAGWNRHNVATLLSLWDRWHLNYLKAGCEHQEGEGWSLKRINPADLPNNTHANRDERGILAIWIYPEEHEDGLLTKPCQICGYKYGTSWKREELPPDIIAQLEKFPASTVTPAWI